MLSLTLHCCSTAAASLKQLAFISQLSDVDASSAFFKGYA